MAVRSALLALVTSALAAAAPGIGQQRTFAIVNDTFILDGKPFQIISGGIHYFRVHPAYWKDRLIRCKALGLNTVELYVPWNFHEPFPGHFLWDGAADLEGFISLARQLDLLVLVRAGPYICAEWEFGGFPWWLASSTVQGGATMRLRSSDPDYLAHVDRWWAQLFARLRPHLYAAGGPVIMMQVENEYGFCGSDPTYLLHLVATARAQLGDKLLLYTTDPARVAVNGSISGGDVLATVDFGPAHFDPGKYYGIQKSLNAPGKSPPMCSEFYSGWLSHWGEAMANTSAAELQKDTTILLQWANSTGSLNFYMVHGGTNFGFWAGADIDPPVGYHAHITSYDYHAPISEAGDYCQPGIGGECKYQVLRAAISAHTGIDPPAAPARPAVRAYGQVSLSSSAPLLSSLSQLSVIGVHAQVPLNMEEYGQRWGLTLYRTQIPPGAVAQGSLLDVGTPVHDFASVLVDGIVVARLSRNGPANVTFKIGGSVDANATSVTLDILVHAMGRQNYGCEGFEAWDLKGLQSSNVTLNGQLLTGWEVFPIQLDDVSGVARAQAPNAGAQGVTTRCLLAQSVAAHNLQDVGMPQNLGLPTSRADRRAETLVESAGPTFYRGTLAIEGAAAQPAADAGGNTHLPDTFLNTRGWGKGLAWVNGFNLGWYWPTLGPQMTLYVPGPVLKEGNNEVVLLEVESNPATSAAFFADAPDFYGPEGHSASAVPGELLQQRIGRVGPGVPT